MKRVIALLWKLMQLGIFSMFIWCLASIAYNLAIWPITGGHGAWAQWGRDKSLSNMVVEMPYVLMATATAFLLSKPWKDSPWRKRALLYDTTLIVAVVLILPGLGE
jgi:hypothetical protein